MRGEACVFYFTALRWVVALQFDNHEQGTDETVVVAATGKKHAGRLSFSDFWE